MRKRCLLLAAILVLALSGAGYAGTVTYDFASNPPPDWVNKSGNWIANGVYDAQSPSNGPPTYAYLPWSVTDFTLEVDINGTADGGIWVHSYFNSGAGTTGWANGILLVTKPSTIYWHIVNGTSYGGSLSSASLSTGNHHVKVVATGNTYAAYIDYETTARTTLNTSSFTSGYVGLYDFSTQTFDNFSLTAANVPLPGTLALLGSGLAGLAVFRRRRNG